jgi:hypothetical protein
LGVALAAFTDPEYTRAVWAVEPTYFLAARIFDDAGVRVRGVGDGGVEGRGVDVEGLRREMERVEKERRDGKGGKEEDRPVSQLSVCDLMMGFVT